MGLTNYDDIENELSRLLYVVKDIEFAANIHEILTMKNYWGKFSNIQLNNSIVIQFFKGNHYLSVLVDKHCYDEIIHKMWSNYHINGVDYYDRPEFGSLKFTNNKYRVKDIFDLMLK